MKVCRESPNLVTVEQKYRARYIDTSLRVIDAGEENWPY